MKAYEKFNKRLAELGLLQEWYDQGSCGRIARETDMGISILVCEGDDDDYSEFQFPPIYEMQRNEDFRRRALKEFCYHEDDDFVSNLARWVVDTRNKCPLYPEDVYFLWDTPYVINFDDDVEECEVASIDEYIFSKTTEEFCEYCEEYVELSQELKVQRCPKCGKWIVPCSACPLEGCCASRCPLERVAQLLNKE